MMLLKETLSFTPKVKTRLTTRLSLNTFPSSVTPRELLMSTLPRFSSMVLILSALTISAKIPSWPFPLWWTWSFSVSSSLEWKSTVRRWVQSFPTSHSSSRPQLRTTKSTLLTVSPARERPSSTCWRLHQVFFPMTLPYFPLSSEWVRYAREDEDP